MNTIYITLIISIVVASLACTIIVAKLKSRIDVLELDIVDLEIKLEKLDNIVNPNKDIFKF